MVVAGHNIDVILGQPLMKQHRNVVFAWSSLENDSVLGHTSACTVAVSKTPTRLFRNFEPGV